MLTLLVFLAAYAIIILLPLAVPLTPQTQESCLISVRKQGDASAS